MHDLACAVHVHSTYSDGTGTIPQIAAAARRSGADVVLMTDHDTLAARRRGEEGWHGPVLVLVGEEVSPSRQNHFLAFGIDDEVDRRLSPRAILAAVAGAGGFGFAAHPFSRGSRRFARYGKGMPWRALDDPELHGIELWNFLLDTAEPLGSLAQVLWFIAAPGRTLDHPPKRNLAEWDRMCAERRVVAIGGIDAHQFGVRVRGRVPLRLMSYRRTFRHLRTHVLCEQAPSGDLDRDRSLVFDALRAGHCYLAVDSLAPARGFAYRAHGPGRTAAMGDEVSARERWTLRAAAPRPAALRLLCAGQEVARAHGVKLEHEAQRAGAYRVEARLEAGGRERTWIVSNPIFLR